MASVYDLMREACGLSQQEAADFHVVRLDSVKSWCSDRRPAPINVITELQVLMRGIEAAGKAFAASLQPDYGRRAFIIGLPADDSDAETCGFPSKPAHVRAIAIAISRLPDGAAVDLVERGRLNLVPTPTMTKEASKMRNVTVPVHHDMPDPAPGGFQAVVNTRPRTRAEVDRSHFRAENGAKFVGVLQDTPAGAQASYTIQADIGNTTSVLSDIRLIGNELDALLWLDQAAALHGFKKYPLERRK
ncbi:hypothetical protein IC762_17295 [Bradyrhizobium genosp. L]|uniref:hypothetical protein n=1 Tax=Bradyrhizobium genosp. L TaxID=83637 RepID=UPI0018A2EFC3|nr:hypothetical protein [Bradyrhizobium genosp. L]QPF81587.1 hypothetical protein IC762_17295 [Bradyrhizobium genosp. L]